jgi:hypothetical protein
MENTSRGSGFQLDQGSIQSGATPFMVRNVGILAAEPVQGDCPAFPKVVPQTALKTAEGNLSRHYSGHSGLAAFASSLLFLHILQGLSVPGVKKLVLDDPWSHNKSRKLTYYANLE